MLLAIATEGSEVETTHALEGNAGGHPTQLGLRATRLSPRGWRWIATAMDCDGA
jgi:hypothetical protein